MAIEEKINILVVDDVPEKLLAMEAILQDLGENVVTVGSGREALRQLLDRDFAVILLDVNMPGMDGFETAALIRQRQRSEHTPIIFVTAFTDETHVYQGYSLGAVDYILAPVVPDVLRAKVSVFVDLYRKTRQVQQQAEERVALAREQMGRAAAENARRRSEYLSDASKALAKSLDFKATLEAVMKLVVPALADSVGITLFRGACDRPATELAWMQPGSAEWRQVVAEADALNEQLLQAICAVGTTAASAAWRPQAQAGAAAPAERVLAISPQEGLDGPELASAILIPLMARNRSLGVLMLGFAPPRFEYSSLDQSLFEELGSRAAMAIDNAMLYGEVQEGDRRKNEFLAMLGHELRNPLAAISSALDLVRLGELDEATVDRAHDILERQVSQMARLVDDLLDVSRITRGKVELRREVVDLAAAVERAVATSASLITTREHCLTVSLPKAPIKLDADPTRLEQVLANLLSNAAKYTEPQGRIWLTAESEQDRVVLRVRDTGIGIPPNLLPKVFDLFTQGNRSLDRSQGGLGIGLTLVRTLVELHGGEVEVFSKGDRQGSEFVVRLPRIREEDHESHNRGHNREQPPCQAVPTRKLLLVDDNVDLLSTMAALLKNAGHEVQTALDGSAALECAGQFQPDIIFVDIGLPGMDGYELARRLREQPLLDKAMVVAMTGYGQRDDMLRSKEAGFDDHLVKPVRMNAVQALLAKLEPLAL